MVETWRETTRHDRAFVIDKEPQEGKTEENYTRETLTLSFIATGDSLVMKQDGDTIVLGPRQRADLMAIFGVL